MSKKWIKHITATDQDKKNSMKILCHQWINGQVSNACAEIEIYNSVHKKNAETTLGWLTSINQQ